MSHGNSPELKQVICKFEPMVDNQYQMYCRKPLPPGPYVFVTKYLDQNARNFVPAVGEYYVVAITGTTKSGKADRGSILFSFSGLRTALLQALKAATWVRDSGRDRHIVGGMLKTPYGEFMPYWDSGWRSNGLDESPSIWFTPDPDGPYAEVLSLANDHLFCTDQAEVERATNAPHEELISQHN